MLLFPFQLANNVPESLALLLKLRDSEFIIGMLVLHSLAVILQCLIAHQQVIYFLEGARVVHFQGQVLLLQLHQALVELGLVLFPLLGLVSRSLAWDSIIRFHILLHRYFPNRLLPLHD